MELVAPTSVDGSLMMGDLLITFARIGRAQFVEAFEFVRVEDISSGPDNYSLEIEVAFVRCK